MADETGLDESKVDETEVDETVKPPNKGHVGDGPFVPCKEVVLFLEVLF